MDTQKLLLFTATVLPLICTPGPDMLFVVSQAMAAKTAAGLRATAGVCLGYGVHSTLVALGIAAVVTTSPILFEALRWLGIAYLVTLAAKLILSACRSMRRRPADTDRAGQLQRGFLTALLNPKGMMIYVAILPQFIDQAANIPLQAAILSAAFIFWCGVVYVILSFAVGRIGTGGNIDDRARRAIEGGAGGLLLLAAGVMATR